MKTIYFLAFMLLVSMSSCLRLDSNLYDNTKTSSYLMDAYTGQQEITLDSTYTLQNSMIHLLPLTSNDNGSVATIYAEYLGDINRISTDTVIMYFHGTKDNMDYYWNRAKLLANTGGKNRFGVMTIDYRGYGMSQGTPTESGMYADAEAALQWLQNNGLTSDRLIIYGFSLGTAAATYRTANPSVLTPAKLILEAPFASAGVMVQDATALAFPPSYFINLSINNGEEIKKVQQPFMWMHGINDAFLNINTQGQVVYNNYQGAYGEAHRIPGATHTNVPEVWGYENYKSAVTAFITHP